MARYLFSLVFIVRQPVRPLSVWGAKSLACPEKQRERAALLVSPMGRDSCTAAEAAGETRLLFDRPSAEYLYSEIILRFARGKTDVPRQALSPMKSQPF